MRRFIFSACGIVVLFLMGALPGRAAILSGDDLLRYCHDAGPANSPDALTGLCDGYIGGTFEVLILARRVCPSPAVTNQQVRDVAVRFIEQHPEMRDNPAVTLIMEASVAAFPCP